MNPFYKKLLAFSMLIQDLSSSNDKNYQELFEIEHPGFPVFKHKARVKPRLSFVKPCPKRDRNLIIDLFNECFGKHKLSV